MQKHKLTRLIATLPKSGTWYSHTFFWCYDQLIRNADAYLAGRFKPDLMKALQDRKIGSKSLHRETLGFDELFICHATCPGFTQSGDARVHEWEALHFPLPYNWGDDYLHQQNAWDYLNPGHNPDARIIYLYRNPLDHFVSYYNHTQSHAEENHRYRKLPDGTRVPINSLAEFVFDAGMLGAYIKHYYTFKQMKILYPGQVLLVPYEHLTSDPCRMFGEILAFIGAAPDTPVKKRLFNDALMMCSKDAIMSIEAQLDCSIVGDQVGNYKHIRSGEIGRWRNHFSQEDIERIESVLNFFNITLAEFCLLTDNDTISLFPERNGIKHQHHQTCFLQQQLIWSGSRLGYLQQELRKGKSIYPAAKSWQSFKHSPYAAPLRYMKSVFRK